MKEKDLSVSRMQQANPSPCHGAGRLEDPEGNPGFGKNERMRPGDPGMV